MARIYRVLNTIPQMVVPVLRKTTPTIPLVRGTRRLPRANSGQIRYGNNVPHGNTTLLIPATPNVPASEIAGWGSIIHVAGDDFNQVASVGGNANLSALWGAGLYNQSFATGLCKQA